MDQMPWRLIEGRIVLDEQPDRKGKRWWLTSFHDLLHDSGHGPPLQIQLGRGYEHAGRETKR